MLFWPLSIVHRVVNCNTGKNLSQRSVHQIPMFYIQTNRDIAHVIIIISHYDRQTSIFNSTKWFNFLAIEGRILWPTIICFSACERQQIFFFYFLFASVAMLYKQTWLVTKWRKIWISGSVVRSCLACTALGCFLPFTASRAPRISSANKSYTVGISCVLW